jgi:replicative DNA helicase
MNAFDIEQIILGILLRHPEQIVRVDIRAEHFANQTCALIFQSMRAAVAAGQEPDVFNVAERLGRTDAVSIVASLWKDAAGSVSNLAHYCGLLKAEARGRALSELLAKSAEDLHAKAGTPDEIGAQLIGRIAELDRGGAGYAVDARGWMAAALNQAEAVHEAAKRGGIVGVPTGIGGLDRVMGGYHKSDLIIVAARPAMGKTAMMLTSAYRAALRGRRVGIISAEMPSVQLGLRALSLAADLPANVLRTGRFTDRDFHELAEGAGRLQALPIMLYDKPACTPSDIMMQAKAWQLSGGLDVLFVDFLTRLTPDEADVSRTREVGKMAAAMKTIARTLDIPVVCLAQLSRECEKRGDKRPVLSDLRDSGEIEQEADIVTFLYREHVYDENADPKEAEILIEKNRHGPIGKVRASYVAEKMMWGDRMSETDGDRWGD